MRFSELEKPEIISWRRPRICVWCRGDLQAGGTLLQVDQVRSVCLHLPL